MTIRTQILFIIIISSLIYSKNDSDYIKKQKLIFNQHQNNVTQLKENYVKEKNIMEKEQKRLLPLYNSLKRDYDSLVDSLDNIVKNRMNQYNQGIDDPEVSGHVELMDRAKQSINNKLDGRIKYYKNKFAILDSLTDFYFDVLLAYESNSININELILDLEGENIAIQKTIERAQKDLYHLEEGISTINFNNSLNNLIAANQYIHEKNYKNAIKECKNAIKIFPELALAYEKLGSAYYLDNNYEDALKNWNIALAMNPNNTNLSQFLSALK